MATISVITTVYKLEDFLHDTLEIFLAQECGDLEYLILDGDSIDETAAYLNFLSYNPKFWLDAFKPVN